MRFGGRWRGVISVCLCVFLAVACAWHVRHQLVSRISSLPLDDAERRVISAANVDSVLRYQLQARSGSILHVSLEHYHSGELVTCYPLGEMIVPKRQLLLYISWTELDSGPVEKWMVALGDQHQVTEVQLPKFSCTASKTGNGAELGYGAPQVLYARSLGWDMAAGFGDGVFSDVSDDWQMLMSAEDAFVLKVTLLHAEGR